MEKEVKIQIPEGYEIDREKSTFERIVFKKKGLTYEDVARKLFSGTWHFCLDGDGCIESYQFCPDTRICDPNNATSREQLEQIIALNKLMNVAKYLNGDWKADWSDLKAYYIVFNTTDRRFVVVPAYIASGPYAYFASEDLAHQAIEILGETEVKKACGIFE